MDGIDWRCCKLYKLLDKEQKNIIKEYIDGYIKIFRNK